MTFKDFVKELNGSRVEGELVKTIFYSLITSIVIAGIFYYFRFRYIDNFMSTYGLYLFLAILSYALVVPTIRQVRAYKQMAFMGGVFGMIVGSTLGIWTGSCCGIMGTMEGMMAGFMGGWMGAMTSVMLVNDNLKLAAIVILIISSAIAFG